VNRNRKIFLGYSESDELTRVGEKKKRQGYVVGKEPHAGEVRVYNALTQNPKRVILEGGSLNACLAIAARLALDNGAKQVIIDLNRCRADVGDTPKNPRSLTQRGAILRDNLPERIKNDLRLIIRPKTV